MKPKNKIKRLRQKNPFMTMPEIASIVGVRKQYVHEVLTKAGLSTIIPSYRSGTYCKICNNNTKYKPLLCSKECRIKYYNLEVTCSFCNKKFLRNKRKLEYSYRMGYEYIHCSRRCYNRRRNQELV